LGYFHNVVSCKSAAVSSLPAFITLAGDAPSSLELTDAVYAEVGPPVAPPDAPIDAMLDLDDGVDDDFILNAEAVEVASEDESSDDSKDDEACISPPVCIYCWLT
jgi:hypothetical protein